MKILLFGKNGQVGFELQRTLATLGEVTALDYPEIDFTNPDALRQTVRAEQPQVIINAAAYTAVDRAESEPETAQAINATAPGVLAEEALSLQAAVIHYSTEYVFDGNKGDLYVESDAPNPLSVYASTKLAGEQAVQAVGGANWVFRTSWVYSMRQGGFVTKVLQWARQQPVLRVVDDQVGNPTWARLLAETTAQLLAMAGRTPYGWISERQGLYHLAGSGHANRYEWAQAIVDLDPKRDEQVVREIQRAKTAEFPTPACRPLHSPLNCERFTDTFGLRLPDWRTALKMCLESNL